MSGLLSQQGSPGVPVSDGQTLEVMREMGLTVELDAAQLRRIHAAMDAAMDAGQKVADMLREAAGPEPSSLPQQLITLLLMGAGYQRVARDTIRALFKARNAAAFRARKKTRAREEAE